MSIATWLGIGKTVADTASALTSGAAEIVTAAKTDPNRAVDAEIEKLRIDAEARIEELVTRSAESARAWSIQYEGRASEIQPWLRVVRNLIRPLTTLLFVGIFATAAVIDFVGQVRADAPWRLLAGLPQGFWWAFGIVLTFWFGGKVGERIAEQIRKE